MPKKSNLSLTTAPVQEGDFTGRPPEFGRTPDATFTFGLKRGTLYNLFADGKIKGCVMLWVFASIFNLHLQSNSPCINAANNAYVTSSTDLDGNPRIVSGAVDMGAYECQGPGSVISYAWLRRYGLRTDGSADYVDFDADGHTTWQEWRCQTDPTSALSALRLLSAMPAGNSVTVTWQSVIEVNYFLERSTNVAGAPPIFTPLATGISGQPGTTSVTDTNAANLSPLFYRVRVGL